MRQHYWFRKDKWIAWRDIAEIRAGMMNGSIKMKSKNSTKIVYTRQYAARARFLKEIRIHCEGQLPDEFLVEEAKSAALGS